jgi:hypothetical protein
MRGGGKFGKKFEKIKGFFGSSSSPLKRQGAMTPTQAKNARQIINQSVQQKATGQQTVEPQKVEPQKVEPLHKTSGVEADKLLKYINNTKSKSPNLSTSNNSHKNLLTSFLAEKSRFGRINTSKLSEASKIVNRNQRQTAINNLLKGKFDAKIKQHLVTTFSSDEGKNFIKHIEEYKKSLEENQTPHANLVNNGTLKIVSNVEKRNKEKEQNQIISNIKNKQSEINSFKYDKNNTGFSKLISPTSQTSIPSNNKEVFNKLTLKKTPLQQLIETKLILSKNENLNKMKSTNISKLESNEIQRKKSEYEGFLDKHSSVLTKNDKNAIISQISKMRYMQEPDYKIQIIQETPKTPTSLFGNVSKMSIGNTDIQLKKLSELLKNPKLSELEKIAIKNRIPELEKALEKSEKFYSP